MTKKSDSDSDITPCLNCKPIEDMKEKDLPYSEAIEEIPDWAKKTGNYSPYPKMITCNERYNLLSDNRDLMVSEKPDITGNPVTLDLDLGKEYKESWVFYWGATSSEDPLHIKGPIESYDSEINHGLEMTDKQGKISFTLNCPQPYKVDGKTYCRHVHYLI